jgi:hypothetical protein
MKLPYKEGSVFALPLRDGGFARGVVARAGKRGKVLFGYFFGPVFESFDEMTLEGVAPRNAVQKLMFGDLELIRGNWRVIGQVTPWRREDWPMPIFKREDPLGRRNPVFVKYSEDNPGVFEGTTNDNSGREVVRDGLNGAGAVEILLNKLLNGMRQE